MRYRAIQEHDRRFPVRLMSGARRITRRLLCLASAA